MEKVKRLNQVLSIEQIIKDRVHKSSELFKSIQKPTLFEGFTKIYRKVDEQGEVFPSQSARVQLIAEDALKTDLEGQKELIDITATKDVANQSANADIVVDGKVLVAACPATTILWLEKRIEDVRTFIQKLPTLDEAIEWKPDTNSSLNRSNTLTTHRTQKVQKPIVLYAATDKHPAQTQLITEDVTIGYWDEVKLSGALSVPRKKLLLERVEKLYRAVKVAREQANMAEAVSKEGTGAALLDFIIS